MLGIYRYMLEWLFLIRKIFQPPKIFLKLLVREFLNMGVPGAPIIRMRVIQIDLWVIQTLNEDIS